MASRVSREPVEKQENRRRKMSKCWFISCFSHSSYSGTELDSDSEYVVINNSVFKIPESLQAVTNDITLNRASAGSSNEKGTTIVQTGSVKKVSGSYNKKTAKGVSEKRAAKSERKNIPHSAKSHVDEKIYQYIRMKTYERMNPYEMSPNDFLNNISSVFIDNLKDPIPKDPTNLPRIFNMCSRRKSVAQIMYEKVKEKEKRISESGSDRKHSEIRSVRKPTIKPAAMSDLNKSYGEDSLDYRAAIEQEDRGKEYDEKVLIWKIVVGNDEDES